MELQQQQQQVQRHSHKRSSSPMTKRGFSMMMDSRMDLQRARAGHHLQHTQQARVGSGMAAQLGAAAAWGRRFKGLVQPGQSR